MKRLGLLYLALLLACSGDSPLEIHNPPLTEREAAVTHIEVTPGTASLQTRQVHQFAAVAVLGDGSTQANPNVAWSATGGTITSSGAYTAGTKAGNYRVIAKSQAGPADTSSVTIWGQPQAPTVTDIDVTPTDASLQIGQAKQFSASATMSDGNTDPSPSVSWSATGGNITQAGLYTAGQSAGTFQVIARSQDGPADTSSVTITQQPAPTVTDVDVTPSSASVQTEQTKQFSASAMLSDGSTDQNPSVTWSATGGTVTQAGLYTAGQSAGTYRVIAKHSTGPADTSSVTITQQPAPTVTDIDVTPTSASLQIGQAKQFSATASLSDGSTDQNPSVTWSATGGTVTQAGLYTAGQNAGTYRVIAKSAAGPADTSTVTITASPPPPPPPTPTVTKIDVTPATASLETSKTKQFSASATMSDGSTDSSPSVTWSATGGTVTPAGLYTAGQNAGTYRVIAKSAAGPADTSTVTITASPPPPPPPTPTVTKIDVTPSTASLQTGKTKQFSASATMSDGSTDSSPSVTWSATGGTITQAGLYTAGQNAGTFRVIAKSSAGPADTSSVTITAPAPPTVTKIDVTPATASLQTGKTKQFSASATMSDGSTDSSPSVTWSATGGTITQAGLYTAGQNAGTFRVIAKSQAGPADTSTVTITAPAPPTVTKIDVTPATASLQTGKTKQFSASATMSDGSTDSSPTVTWSATGGTISSAGPLHGGPERRHLPRDRQEPGRPRRHQHRHDHGARTADRHQDRRHPVDREPPDRQDQAVQRVGHDERRQHRLEPQRDLERHRRHHHARRASTRRARTPAPSA